MSNVHQTAQVRYRRELVNGYGRRVWRSNWSRNLILDSGLEFVAGYAWAQCFCYLALGTTTNPTKRDSGSITFTRTWNVVTASAGFFTAGDVGRLLKFDSGAEMKITAFTDSQTVTVSSSGTLGVSEGTVWYVNDTGHGAEFLRTNSVSTSTGDCASTFLTDTWTHQRTFLTPVFGTSQTVKEIGWAPAAAGSLFGRDLVSGGGDYVPAGMRYKVIVQLSCRYSPTSSTDAGDVGTGGIVTTGAHGLEFCLPCTVTGNGSTVSLDGGSSAGYSRFLEPSGSNYFNVSLCTATTAIQPISAATGTAATGAVGAANLWPSAYVSGSFRRDFSCTFAENTGNSAAIRSIHICNEYSYTGNGRAYWRQVFSAAQTKDNLHTLSLTWSMTWGRTLTN